MRVGQSRKNISLQLLAPMSELTMAAFAKRRGVSKSAVTKWKQRGLLVFTSKGLVDVAASEARLTERPAVYQS
jgi:hypothetical protein